MNKAAKTIIDCLERKKMTQRQLAKMMGEDVRNLNQQLNRQKDMKVERFEEVLEHIGYKMEIVGSNGIQKVCEKFAMDVIANREPKGVFWYQNGDKYIRIDNSDGKAHIMKFDSKKECTEMFIRK